MGQHAPLTKAEFENLQRVLVIKLGAVGDFVLAFGPFRIPALVDATEVS